MGSEEAVGDLESGKLGYVPVSNIEAPDDALTGPECGTEAPADGSSDEHGLEPCEGEPGNGGDENRPGSCGKLPTAANPPPQEVAAEAKPPTSTRAASRIEKKTGPEADVQLPASPRTKRCSSKKTSSADWFPRGKTESYLERKIRMLQEEQGLKTSLDETLCSSSRHLSRIEREKRAAVAAARYATETRKAALVEASWCRILKAAGIPYMSAALELQKAEKVAAEAFKKAVALGVILRTNTGNQRADPQSRPATPGSKHKITASLDTAFEVDEEVAAAVKAALQCVEAVDFLGCKSEKLQDDVDNKDLASDGEVEQEGKSEAGEPVTPKDAGRGDDSSSSGSEPEDLEPKDKAATLPALMRERVTGLESEQRAALATIVETRGLNALLKEERYEQELGAKNGRGGLGDVLVKHMSRLETEKAAAAAKAASSGSDLKHARKKSSQERDAWGGLDLGSSLKRHVSKLEAEQAAWRRAEEEARNRAAANVA